MRIKSLKLKNYRNYDFLQMDFDEHTNILYGDNAQGKTNILESIYISGTTKSHRGSKDKELIRFEAEEGHIESVIDKKSMEYKIDIHYKKTGSKGIAINKVPIKRASELLGLVQVVLFSPEDLNIIKNGPSERRRFVDMELSQLDKVYMNHLMNYNKALNQRNKLLKEITFHPQLIDTLEVWDEQIVKYGEKVIEERIKFIDQVNKIIANIHNRLTGGIENIKVYYEPANTGMSLREALKRNKEKDVRYKSTSVGPHRDDIGFLINDVDIRKYGSQGQQRTAALSLKLSEIELVKSMTGDSPILLLDDVLSELDKNRQNYLLDSIHDIQTIITCTGLDEFVNNRFTINKVFYVENGKVTMEN